MMPRALDAFGSGGFASRTVLALVGQPWSNLRLKAYSFIWLCFLAITCQTKSWLKHLMNGPAFGGSHLDAVAGFAWLE